MVTSGKPLSERSSRLSCSYRGATYTFSRQTSQLWIIRLASRFLSILLRRNICLFDKVSFEIKYLPPSGRFKSSFQTISSLSFESVWECEGISNDTNEDLNIDKYICLFWKAANQICWSFWREGTKISAFSNINQGNKEYLYAIYFDICAIISWVHRKLMKWQYYVQSSSTHTYSYTGTSLMNQLQIPLKSLVHQAEKYLKPYSWSEFDPSPAQSSSISILLGGSFRHWNATILKRYTLYSFMWWDIMMMRCSVDCEPLALHLKIVSNWFWSGAWQCNQWQVLCNILPSNTPHLPHPPPRLFHLVASLALPPGHSTPLRFSLSLL